MKAMSLVVVLWAVNVCLASDRTSNLANGRSCQRKCQALAHRVYRECRHNGGSEEECKVAAKTAFDRCVEENCHSTQNCESRCQHEALDLYNACVADHGDPEACAARARTALLECLTEHCSIPYACEKRCEYLGHALVRLCLAEGGSQDQCANQAHILTDRCKQEHCPPCGGIMGTPCPKGEFCLFPPGTCDVADNVGVCMTPPQACPDIYEPVCGCDGVTYSNGCEAAAAGVSIDYASACRQRCGRVGDEPCLETEYCFLRGGGCPTPDAPGICRGRFPAEFPCSAGPVCGCDGKTYRTYCEASTAGTAFEFYGLCEPDECFQHDPVGCSEGSFCQTHDGECNLDSNFGNCVAIPEFCDDEPLIVCGCDGRTYGSRCGAQMAGVSIDHEGYCQTRYCGGDPAPGYPGCLPGSFCGSEPGQCSYDSVCIVIPTSCPDVTAPICGCDGKTYGNACEAATAEISIYHEGFCVEECGGIFWLECPPWLYCVYPPGDCNESGALLGRCNPISTPCSDTYDPVCGCDGVTYGNECKAIVARSYIKHEGVCQD